MKKLLLLSGLAVAICSCQSAPPKETAQNFIKALAGSDLTTASSLVSSNTKAVLDKAKKEVPPTVSPDESFQLATLSETISGNKAEVKNEIVSLHMVKEKEGWKVVLNEDLLMAVQDREAMVSAAKMRWETLQKEYEARRKILNDYVSYKKSLGTLSTKVQALNDAVQKTVPENEWTGEKLQAYVQKQQTLIKVIDAALEPTQAASTDLTLQYFVQISMANDRIKAAEAAYQEAAQKAHSPVYVPLPFRTANEPKVNNS